MFLVLVGNERGREETAIMQEVILMTIINAAQSGHLITSQRIYFLQSLGRAFFSPVIFPSS